MTKQEIYTSMIDELTIKEAPDCDEKGQESDPFDRSPLDLLSHDGKIMLMNRRIENQKKLIEKYKTKLGMQ